MKSIACKNIFFIGIGGIGMSALARWCQHVGKNVAGYDKTPTALTQNLVKEGIAIHFEDRIENLPQTFLSPEDTLVIYTPAIPKDHAQWQYFKSQNFTIYKRAELLGMLSQDHYTIAVAGTHGKTTTSSMIAHILFQSKVGCHALIGGIMTNYQSNLLMGDKNAPLVVEADEYDRSFWQLFPNYTLVTSVDSDHLDIYQNEDQLIQAFHTFIQNTKKDGKILIAQDAQKKLKINPVKTYHIENADARVEDIEIKDEGVQFTYRYGNIKIENLKLHMGGIHNVTNAIAAITVACDLGIDPADIKRNLQSYRGVKRRFEVVLKHEKLIIIDDYAHHPKEIESLLQAVRTLYKNRKLTVVFQPHLYTRTRDFLDGFASSLDRADSVILLPIYPARELPIRGITAKRIYDKMKLENKMLCEKQDLIASLNTTKQDLIVTVGAGDIDKEVIKIVKHYQEKLNLKSC